MCLGGDARGCAGGVQEADGLGEKIHLGHTLVGEMGGKGIWVGEKYWLERWVADGDSSERKT